MGGGSGGGMGGGGMGGMMMTAPTFGGGTGITWPISPSGMFGAMINLPIPAALDNSTPAIVSASLTFGAAGQYSWWCAAPCDPVAMATAGYMRGTVTAT